MQYFPDLPLHYGSAGAVVDGRTGNFHGGFRLQGHDVAADRQHERKQNASVGGVGNDAGTIYIELSTADGSFADRCTADDRDLSDLPAAVY